LPLEIPDGIFLFPRQIDCFHIQCWDFKEKETISSLSPLLPFHKPARGGEMGNRMGRAEEDAQGF
jgi:hypothetical protein